MTATLPRTASGASYTDAAAALRAEWAGDVRWSGIERSYTAEDVVRLRGSVVEEHTLARRGAQRLWNALQRRREDGARRSAEDQAPHTKTFVRALGALTGNQAVQMVRGGLESIYLSGWQVAADANLAGQTYPDQSLYPANSVPAVVRRINNALQRADQIDWSEGRHETDYLVPIVADAEAGFGGPLNAFELMKSMIAAGAAGVHFEDQLASEKKCGHLGGKVLVPTSQHVRTLNAARLGADVLGVPTLVVARTDALAADLLTSDIDPVDQPFVTGTRTSEGFFRVRNGIEPVLARAKQYARFADLIWVETGTPDLGLAREFATELHREFPGKMLAYNCSPSFNWRAALSDAEIATFQDELGDLGYRYQFITLAGFHALNHSMFGLAHGYSRTGMSAYVQLQEAEFAAATKGYTAIRHQAEVGTGYFDKVSTAINPDSGTLALVGSTESEQFH
jgi:isocitrate lyase